MASNTIVAMLTIKAWKWNTCRIFPITLIWHNRRLVKCYPTYKYLPWTRKRQNEHTRNKHPARPSQHFFGKLSALCTFVYTRTDYQWITTCRQTCFLYALPSARCTFYLHCLHYLHQLTYASITLLVPTGYFGIGRALNLSEQSDIRTPYARPMLPWCCKCTQPPAMSVDNSADRISLCLHAVTHW